MVKLVLQSLVKHGRSALFSLREKSLYVLVSCLKGNSELPATYGFYFFFDVPGRSSGDFH